MLSPLTSAHRELRSQVASFAEQEITPRIARLESQREIEHHLAMEIARQGWLGATISGAFGGMASGDLAKGHLAKTIILEEVSKVSAAMAAMVQASQLGVAKIIHFGSRKQQETWLPAIAAGEHLPTIAVTEPESGSHLLAMQTTARRRGDHYVLNGRKVFVGNSHIGTLHGVVARTGEERRRDKECLSAFLVEADRPGVVVSAHPRFHGLRGFSFGEVRFDNVQVPVSNLVGQEGEGLLVALSSSLLYGRANFAAVAVGLIQAVVDTTTAYLKGRPRFGKTLADLPENRVHLGDMQSSLITSRTLAYSVADLLDRGEACDADLLNAKLVACDKAVWAAQIGMRLHGAAGLECERPIVRYRRDADCLDAPAGTSDVQIKRLSEVAVGTKHVDLSSLVNTSVDPRRSVRSAGNSVSR